MLKTSLGVEEGLGSKVADVGCGYGVSTILMAKAYPNSTVLGFDYHTPSIEWARKADRKRRLEEYII